MFNNMFVLLPLSICCTTHVPLPIYNKVSQTSINDSASFMARVKDTGLFPVQTIGLENITAGILAGNGNAQCRVFLHGKVKPGAGLDIIIRASQPALSQALNQFVQVHFKWFCRLTNWYIVHCTLQIGIMYFWRLIITYVQIGVVRLTLSRAMTFILAVAFQQFWNCFKLFNSLSSETVGCTGTILLTLYRWTSAGALHFFS